MTFWKMDELQLEQFRPGIMSKASIGDNLIMVVMEIGAAMQDAGHEHPFDQCGLVLEGVIEMFIGEERRRLSPNECYFIPAGVRHGWQTFDQPVKLLDVSAKPPIK